MRLRCGSDLSSSKDIPFGKILDHAKGQKVNLSEKDIIAFLNNGLYKENQKRNLFFKILNAILNSTNIVYSVAFDKLSDFLGGTIPEYLDKLKISNSRWDPTHKDYSTQGLFREELEQIRQKSKNETEKTSKTKEFFKSYFASSVKSILEKGDGFIKDLNKYAMMSSNISKKIEYFWGKIGKNALDFISQFESLIDALDTIADTIIKSLIAYICGLINGIVEFIMGTFELIGLICKSASFVLDISKDKRDAIDWVVEMTENLTDMIDKIDLSEYFVALGKGMKDLFYTLIYNLKNIDKIKINAESIIKFAYFCGYFVGFVVGVVLEAFLTGGVAAVKELAQLFKAGVARGSRGIRSLGKRSLDSMKTFAKFFDDLFRQVTKDPKAVFERFKQWIKDIIQAVKKELGLVDEVEQEAKRIMKQIGAIEYEMLSSNLLKKYIDEMVEICTKKGIKIEIKWIEEGHPDFHSNLMGRLRVSTNKKNVLELNLRRECPKITLYHERWHIEDFLEMGWKKYTDISKKTPWLHEEAVWNRIFKNSNKWSEIETVDAYLYYKWYCEEKYFVNPILNKAIEKILPKYQHLIKK